MQRVSDAIAYIEAEVAWGHTRQAGNRAGHAGRV